MFGGNDLWQLWKNVLYQLEIDMDPRYVQLPKGSGDSLGHQCFLTSYVLGHYPILHGSGKTDSSIFAQTTTLGLPHGWELVNQVGFVSLFTWQVLSMANYFGVPLVLLKNIFRDIPK